MTWQANGKVVAAGTTDDDTDTDFALARYRTRWPGYHRFPGAGRDGAAAAARRFPRSSVCLGRLPRA